MGWLWMVAFAVMTFLGLWKLGRVERQNFKFVIAALIVALAGYALQGSPNRLGVPSISTSQTVNDAVPDELRKSFASSMNSEGQWLALADALLRAGKTRAAVSILGEGSRRAPFNPDIWVGLGNALVVHGGGQMNPAALFAFERAAQLSPDHPGPPFFIGLGLAQQGKLDQAGEIWRALLAKAPKGAEWKADLVERLRSINQLSADSPAAGAQTAD
jgi:cytochrome c-type biogenesis protein CcmH